MNMAFGGVLMVLIYLAIPLLILYEFVSFHRKTTRQLAAIEEQLKSISCKIENR
ncbi:MAG: hypothetical protein HPY50_14065 [Firmicutes bacterium]|nr:hypothetical protein [Bacillota bacterium]